MEPPQVHLLVLQDVLRLRLHGRPCHLIGKGGECVCHVVDGLGQGCDLALWVYRELLGQLAVCHRRKKLTMWRTCLDAYLLPIR